MWGDDSKVSIFDARRRASESPDEKSAITEAAEWLENFLALKNGCAASAEIKAPGASAGHSYDSLKRAPLKIGSLVESSGFPRRTYSWHPKENQI